MQKWYNNDPRTFVVLKEKTDVALFSERIKNYIATKSQGYRHTLFIQKYSDRYLNGNYENGLPVGGRIQYIQLFAIIAALILLIAWITMSFQTIKAAKANPIKSLKYE